MGEDDELGDVGGARLIEQFVECGPEIGGGDFGGEGDAVGRVVLSNRLQPLQLLRIELRRWSLQGGRSGLLGGQWTLTRLSRTY